MRRITTEPIEFRDILTELQAEYGMTQSELAQLLNVSPSAVSRWQSGDRVPSLSLFFYILERLGKEIYIH